MHIVRSGGKYSRARQRFYEIEAAAFIILGAILLFILPIPYKWILGVTFFIFGLHYLRRSRNWRKGIKGEKKVVEALMPLDNSYVLINDVVLPEGKGNIDHILVGTNGVFVIETKSYKWHYLNRFPLRQVIRNAVSLRYFLKGQIQFDMFVTAILVSTDPNATMSQRSSTVNVINLRNLCDFIKDQRNQSVLDRDMIRKLVHEILNISRLNESGVNIYKGLLKPTLVFGAILLLYTFWTFSGRDPYSRYHDEFHKYKQRARTEENGIWSKKIKPLQRQTEVTTQIVGNKQSKIYHTLGQASYHQIKEENRVYFNSEEAAVRAGYRKAKK